MIHVSVTRSVRGWTAAMAMLLAGGSTSLLAAVLETDTPFLETVAIRSPEVTHLPGWLDDGMLLDYARMPPHQAFSSLSRTHEADLTRTSLRLETFDPWNFPMETLREFHSVFPGDPALAYRLASMLYRTGERSEALDTLERCIAITPEDENTVNLYLGMLVAENRPAEAAEFAVRAIERFPGNRTIWFNAACAHARQREVEDALHYLGIAATMDWPELIYLLNDRDFDLIRAEPRFVALQDLLLLNSLKSLVRAN